MRLLILGAPILNAAFRQLGHHVTQFGIGQNSDALLSHPVTLERLLQEMETPPDAVLYMDNGNLPQVLGLEAATVPTVFYSVDTFCNPWHVPYAAAVDRTLVAQYSQLALFTQEGHAAEWLPLFASRVSELDADFFLRDVPVAFVGTLNPSNIPTRHPFLQRFRKFSPLVVKQGEYVPIFTRSRIVLNQTAFSELNYRCFEAAGCGAALLMEAVPDLTRLFTPGETVLPPYPKNDAASAAAVAREWLDSPQNLARVAKAGHDLVANKHSALCRAKTIAALMESLCRGRVQDVRLAELPRRRIILSTAFAILLLELQGSAFAAHRDLYGKVYTQLLDAE